MAAAMNSLFFKALVAFIALPGVVAYIVPALLLGPGTNAQTPGGAGLAGIAAGTALLLWCVGEFYVSGKGTLAPWTPPIQLVVSGPYRFSRNPMYVAVALVLCGWTLAFRSRAHAIYTAASSSRFISGSCSAKSRGSRAVMGTPGSAIGSESRDGWVP